MRAGRLDRLITIQRHTVTLSPSGEPIETWATTVARRPAAIWTSQADEQFRDPLIVARQKVEWLIRYSADVADLRPIDRVIYPALSDASPEDVPDDRNVYDIIAVHEVGKFDGLRLVTARRPDVP